MLTYMPQIIHCFVCNKTIILRFRQPVFLYKKFVSFRKKCHIYVRYKVSNAGWKYLLTSITTVDYTEGGSTTTETMDYDAIGNPTSYLGATLSWRGRKLKIITLKDLNIQILVQYPQNHLDMILMPIRLKILNICMHFF